MYFGECNYNLSPGHKNPPFVGGLDALVARVEANLWFIVA
jgi:hypothetical protein